MLPLINFWLMPFVFPASAEEICHKYRFIMKMLVAMGLPLMDEESGMVESKSENGLLFALQ